MVLEILSRPHHISIWAHVSPPALGDTAGKALGDRTLSHWKCSSSIVYCDTLT
jgi:hypothetical protein